MSGKRANKVLSSSVNSTMCFSPCTLNKCLNPCLTFESMFITEKRSEDDLDKMCTRISLVGRNIKKLTNSQLFKLTQSLWFIWLFFLHVKCLFFFCSDFLSCFISLALLRPLKVLSSASPLPHCIPPLLSAQFQSWWPPMSVVCLTKLSVAVCQSHQLSAFGETQSSAEEKKAEHI